MDQEPLAILAKEFPEVVIPLIDSADFTIDIIVYDWRFYLNDPANPVSLFNTAIIRAVKRGVQVRCLVNNSTALDTLKNMGCWAKDLYSAKVLHTKLLIVDKRSIILGSHNYTQNAFSSNHECSVFFKLKREENAFVEYFNNLFGL